MEAPAFWEFISIRPISSFKKKMLLIRGTVQLRHSRCMDTVDTFYPIYFTNQPLCQPLKILCKNLLSIPCLLSAL